MTLATALIYLGNLIGPGNLRTSGDVLRSKLSPIAEEAHGAPFNDPEPILPRHPSNTRHHSGGHASPVPRRDPERSRLCLLVPHPVEQLCFLADRCRAGLHRRGAGAGYCRPVPAAAPRSGRGALRDSAGGDVDCGLSQCSHACAGRLGEHANWTGAVRHCSGPELCRNLVRLLHTADGRSKMKPLLRAGIPQLWVIVPLAALLSACGGDQAPLQYGAAPDLPEPKRGLLPDMVIADPAEWGDQLPVVPEGYTVSAIATDLNIPRQTLILPNGDILVAEGRGGNAPSLKPKDVDRKSVV